MCLGAGAPSMSPSEEILSENSLSNKINEIQICSTLRCYNLYRGWIYCYKNIISSRFTVETLEFHDQFLLTWLDPTAASFLLQPSSSYFLNRNLVNFVVTIIYGGNTLQLHPPLVFEVISLSAELQTKSYIMNSFNIICNIHQGIVSQILLWNLQQR